jgi:quercetin dioxygenase-like cupin family protein
MFRFRKRLRARDPLVLAFLGGAVFFAGWASATLGVSRGQTMADVRVYQSPNGGTQIKLLLDESNLGGTEIEIGEITFPPGANSGSHPHGSTEIFYVLEGELEHVVNGESHVLGPGMLGFVRPPDSVNHIVPGDQPVKALVIWAPGGEAQRIVSRWDRIE